MSDTKDSMEFETGVAATSEHLHLQGNAIEQLSQLGAKAAGVSTIRIPGEPFGIDNEIPIAIKHGENPRFESLKPIIDEWRTRPERRLGTAVVGDLESFIALVNRHKTEHSVVFASSDWKKPSLTAVIDYHSVDANAEADHGRHRIHYPFPLSEEWNVWVAGNDKRMLQADFAEFIEERLPDLSAPTDAVKAWAETDLGTTIATPAKLMELSRGLQVNASAKVKNAQNLQSGEMKLVFEEEHTGADGKPISVPGGFMLRIPIFYNAEAEDVPVRLRYRLGAGAISWTYLLFRPDRIIAEAVHHAKNDVRSGTDLPVYEGAPEMSVPAGAILGRG